MIDTNEAEHYLVERQVVVALQGAAAEVLRMRVACLQRDIPAMVGPCSGSS